jgi:hypothetical protein
VFCFVGGLKEATATTKAADDNNNDNDPDDPRTTAAPASTFSIYIAHKYHLQH